MPIQSAEKVVLVPFEIHREWRLPLTCGRLFAWQSNHACVFRVPNVKLEREQLAIWLASGRAALPIFATMSGSRKRGSSPSWIPARTLSASCVKPLRTSSLFRIFYSFLHRQKMLILQEHCQRFIVVLNH